MYILFFYFNDVTWRLSVSTTQGLELTMKFCFWKYLARRVVANFEQ